MSRDDDLEIVKAAYRFHLALVANSQVTEESWKASKKNATGLFNDLINLLHPWGARTAEQRREEEVNHLGELYRKLIVGNHTPEEWEAIVEAEAARMRVDDEAEPESADERVERLAAARINKEAELARRRKR